MGRTAVVMSGGGAKGSFELGAVDYLIRDLGVDPDVFVGVSTGNLNAAMLAQGMGPFELRNMLDRLHNIWLQIDDEDDIYIKRFEGIPGLIFGAIFKADSLYHNKPLWKLIKNNVSTDKLKNSGRILRVGVVGLMSGEYYVVDGSHPQILEMVRASASIPVYFWPIDLLGDRFVDGGVRDITPLSAAFKALEELRATDPPDADESPDTIYIILASPLKQEVITDKDDLDSGIEIAGRSVGLLTNEIYRSDIETALTVNETIQYFNEVKKEHPDLPDGFPYGNRRVANIVVIEPKKLHIGSLEFDPVKIRAAIEAGKARAKEAVEAARATGSNLTSGHFKRVAKVLRG